MTFQEPRVPGFRNPSCQHRLGLEVQGEVTMRQRPLPPPNPCQDLFSLGDPLTLLGLVHPWEWREGARLQTGLPMCRY